jgi:acyl-CoA thioesterase FadM
MSIQAGATALEKAHGGRGVLLGGVPGVMPGTVVVIGGGVVGFNAAQMAVGLGADVTILDRDPEVLERLGIHFESRAKTRFSNEANLAEMVAQADLVIGAVLVPGAAAPKLVTREMLSHMKAGSVLVDVAIDQGGCFETSHATTHWMRDSDPAHNAAYAWFVLRHEIDYRGNVGLGDVVKAETRITEGPSGARFDRHFKFTDAGGKELVRAKTTWAMIDRATGKLTRVPAEVSAPFLTP